MSEAQEEQNESILLEGIEDGSLTVTGVSVTDEGVAFKIEGFKWHPDYLTMQLEGKK